MAVITYGAATPPTKASARRPGPFMRFFNAFAEARMKAAYREIARHSHLLPHELEEAAALCPDPRSEDKLPFIH